MVETTLRTPTGTPNPSPNPYGVQPEPLLYACMTAYTLYSGINALRVRIDLHPPLRHLGSHQEIQRHPNQMTPDLIQFLPHLGSRHVRVVEMALLDVVSGQEVLVVVKGFDCA